MSDNNNAVLALFAECYSLFQSLSPTAQSNISGGSRRRRRGKPVVILPLPPMPSPAPIPIPSTPNTPITIQPTVL